MAEGEELVTRYKTIKLYGISADEVKNQIQDMEGRETPKIKIEPHDAETHIIISAAAESEEEALTLIKPFSREIKKRFGNAIYSTRENETIEMAVVRLLEKYELTVSTAESCTGGLLAGRLINVPGVSDVFKEGFISYSNKAKRKTLDVSRGTLKKYGAVSKQTAKEMATGAVFAADADTSVSGIAGPDGGTDKKPVGLCYIGCYMKDKVTVEEFHFTGDRMQIREQAVNAALNLLRKLILENYK